MYLLLLAWLLALSPFSCWGDVVQVDRETWDLMVSALEISETQLEEQEMRFKEQEKQTRMLQTLYATAVESLTISQNQTHEAEKATKLHLEQSEQLWQQLEKQKGNVILAGVVSGAGGFVVGILVTVMYYVIKSFQNTLNLAHQ